MWHYYKRALVLATHSRNVNIDQTSNARLDSMKFMNRQSLWIASYHSHETRLFRWQNSNFKNENFIQCYRHYILVASLSMCFIVLEMNLHPKFLFTCIWQISQIIINFTIFYLQIFHTIAIILLIISTLILLIGITHQMLSYHNTIFDYEVPFIVAMFVASVSFITGTQQFVIPSAMIKRKLIDFDICDFISFF